MSNIIKVFKEFIDDERGVGVVEIVLIIMDNYLTSSM